MVRTPWGDSDQLRSKKMRSGRGNPRDASARSQRERLFGALVAVSSEKGYEATRIGDLTALAGVSRAAFYKHFRDKDECLVAAVDALISPTLELVERAEGDRTGKERLRQAVAVFLGLVSEQPAAARLCFVEAYAAGPAGEAELDRVLDAFESFAERELHESNDGRVPSSEVLRALLGGIQKIIEKRLYGERSDELPRLAGEISEWLLSYEAPPRPLRPPRRRGRRSRPFDERQSIAHPPERVLRALAAVVAEKGYSASTVAEVVDRAATSQRVFYGHFDNKEDALLAALDSAASQMLSTVLPAYRRAKSWPEAVRGGFEAMFAFGIEEPEYTHLWVVDMYTAGRRALETRDRVLEAIEALFSPGYELAPDTPQLASEAIGGAVFALMRAQVQRNGPESLPEMAPTATYLTLAPFIGAEAAYERATEEPHKW